MKGQVTLNDMPRFAITLGLALIAISVTAIILEDIRDTQTESVNAQVINESTGTLNYGSYDTVTNVPLVTVDVVTWNGSEVITSGNYTVDAANNRWNWSTIQVANRSLNFSAECCNAKLLNISHTEADIIRIVRVINATNGFEFQTSNLTVLNDGSEYAQITNSTGYPSGFTNATLNVTWVYARYNNTNVNVTYTYTRSVANTAVNITTKGLGGVETFAENMDVVAVVVAAVIIIGLILGALILSQRSSRGRSVGGV